MKNKVKLMIIFIVIVISSTLCYADNSDVNIMVNGKIINFDQSPILIEGRFLVPVRSIFESLGATVKWNGKTKTVTAIKGDTDVVLTIDSNEMIRNGKSYIIDVPAQIIKDRTMVPVRAVSEAFNCKVDWDQANNLIKIYEVKGDLDITQANSDNKPSSATPTPYVNKNEKNAKYATFTSQYGALNQVNAPEIAFDYPSDWMITDKEINGYEIMEKTTVSSGNGVNVNYMYHRELNNSSKEMMKYEVTEVANTSFIPGSVLGVDYSYQGGLIICSVKSIGVYDLKTGKLSSFDGNTYYAVLPRNSVGIHDKVAGTDGFLNEFSFKYGGYYNLYAEKTTGKFTDDEKQEVINILSSVR